MALVNFIVFLLVNSVLISASNVLMVLPLGSKSHKNIFIPIADSLANRGHNVTIVSSYSSSSNGSRTLAYNDVVTEQAFEKMKADTGEFNVFKMREKYGAKNVNSHIMKIMIKHIGEYCESFLTDPAVKDVWNMKPDVILLPAFMNECGLAFVHKFKVPFIYVTTSGLTPWTADLVGNPEHPAYVPNQYLSYSSDMTLWQRTINTLMRVGAPLVRKYTIMKRLESSMQKVMNDYDLSISSIENNVSMVLVNSHHSMGTPRPLLPNVIEIGGMHCREANTLEHSDPELHSFLTNGKHTILFSLGSHIESSIIPEKYLNILIETFARIPYQVIWKFEGAPPQNLSSNVMTRSWLPQQDILGYPSIKAFMTHGGLLSMQEAVYHGVPLVGIPMMSDQYLNTQQAVNLGIGKSVLLENMTVDNLVKTLKSVIKKKSYTKNVNERSQILKDQETTPLARATYWVEYIIRNKGAEHLKSKSTELSFIQYYLLDVGFLLLIPLSIPLTIVYFLLKGINIVLMYILRKIYNILKNKILRILALRKVKLS